MFWLNQLHIICVKWEKIEIAIDGRQKKMIQFYLSYWRIRTQNFPTYKRILNQEFQIILSSVRFIEKTKMKQTNVGESVSELLWEVSKERGLDWKCTCVTMYANIGINLCVFPYFA